MKKQFLRISALCLTLLCLVGIFCSCGDKKPTVLEPAGDGTYFCKKTGVSYRPIEDERYEAVRVGEEYGELHDGELIRTLYSVEGLSPEKWLITESGVLFCEAGISLPAPEHMNISTVSICKTNVLTLPISSITDRTDVNAILDVIRDGERLPASAANGEPESWRIKMESSDWEGICYGLILRRYGNGLFAYDKLSDGEAAEVEAAIAEKMAGLTENELMSGVTIEPELPESYTPLTSDPRVKVTLKKYTIPAKDGTETIEWDVIYDYGTYFLYDRNDGELIPVWDLFIKYMEGTSGTETESGETSGALPAEGTVTDRG